MLKLSLDCRHQHADRTIHKPHGCEPAQGHFIINAKVFLYTEWYARGEDGNNARGAILLLIRVEC